MHRILVTGATGYIGGRLIPCLLNRGYQVRVMVRNPQRLQGRVWADQVEVVTGDVLAPETLKPALSGVDFAYYLIHSMGSGTDFHQRDLTAARNFGRAAQESGVQRIIYLGGLGETQSGLSTHLRSRQDTGNALRESGVPVTEFQAAVIVGSGSLSFEIIRYLTERLPVMICPRWVFTRIQPIAVPDVLTYLTLALESPQNAGKTIEIGGADVTSYGGMIAGYAKVRGFRRLLLPVPVLTPRLSSYWVHWVTPVPASIASYLLEGLRNEVVVRSPLAQQIFPSVKPLTYSEAVGAALDDLDAGRIETSWSDALNSRRGGEPTVGLTTIEGIIFERRQRRVSANADVVYRTFAGIGGRRGWFYAGWAWRLRGIVDRLLGGSGLRRGRRHPDELRVGDAVDFFRVDEVESGQRIRMRAEMKVPGRAWLQFEATPQPDGTTLLEQTAAFAPRGVWGLVYWYALYPVHRWIFSGLVRKIAARAEANYDGPGG